MNYNDFPILSNEEYQLLNSHFSTSNISSRKDILFKILNEISNCKNLCFNIEQKQNFKLKTSLEFSFNTLTKLENNLSTSFNLKTTSSQSYKSVNIFSFTKKITKLSTLVSSWHSTEQKEYFKAIAHKTLIDLLSILENIFTALETSNVLLFKHM